MGLLEVIINLILEYISIVLGIVITIIVQKAIQLIILLISTAWPKKIKTPSGERYISSEPVIPPQGGMLFPFIQTTKAMEMLEEKRRITYTSVGFLTLAFVLLIIKESISKQEFLIALSKIFITIYDFLQPILKPLVKPLLTYLASIHIYLDPIIMTFLLLLAFIGILARELIDKLF